MRRATDKSKMEQDFSNARVRARTKGKTMDKGKKGNKSRDGIPADAVLPVGGEGALPSRAVAKKEEGKSAVALSTKFPHVTLTETGLLLSPGISFEEWRDAGRELGRLYRYSLLTIGDWIVQGTKQHDKDRIYQEMGDITGLTYEALRKAEYVAGQVLPDVRRRTLKYSHYDAVASLSSDEQDYWLERAEKEPWTVAELRRQVNANKTPSGKSEDEFDFPFLGEAFRRFRTRVENAQDTEILLRLRHDGVEQYSKIESTLNLADQKLKKMGAKVPPLEPRIREIPQEEPSRRFEVISEKKKAGCLEDIKNAIEGDLGEIRATIGHAFLTVQELKGAAEKRMDEVIHPSKEPDPGPVDSPSEAEEQPEPEGDKGDVLPLSEDDPGKGDDSGDDEFGDTREVVL